MSGQILFVGDDQKVVEEVEVDAVEGHFRVVRDSQLLHGTLVHQKTPAYNQRDRLCGGRLLSQSDLITLRKPADGNQFC